MKIAILYNIKHINPVRTKEIEHIDLFYCSEDNIIKIICDKDSFDKILLFLSKESLQTIMNKLIDGGIAAEKIIECTQFSESYLDRSLCEKYFKRGIKYNHYILGMSHSAEGIKKKLFKSFYSFSASSMDLFYFYSVIRKMNEKGMLVDCCIDIEMPYYIFNYDFSKSNYIFPLRMNSYMGLESWHNFSDDQCINSFLFLKSLKWSVPLRMIRKISKKWVRLKSEFFIFSRKLFCRKYEGKEFSAEERFYIEQLSSHVWGKMHYDTIDENITIWNMLREILENKEIPYRIIVFPMNPIFIQSHEKSINNMKVLFYENMNNVIVTDDFNYFEKNEGAFADDCHLNDWGRKIYSSRLFDILKP